MGISINIFACVYLVVVVFSNLWPPAVPVTGSTMNSNRLVMGVVMLFTTTYYLFHARKTYSGPVVEMEPLEQFFGLPECIYRFEYKESFAAELQLT